MSEQATDVVVAVSALVMLGVVLGPRIIELMMTGGWLMAARARVVEIHELSPMRVTLYRSATGAWAERARDLGACDFVARLADGSRVGARSKALTILADGPSTTAIHVDGDSRVMVVRPHSGMRWCRARTGDILVSDEALSARRRRLLLICLAAVVAVGLVALRLLAVLPATAAAFFWLLLLASTRLVGPREWYESRSVALAEREVQQRLVETARGQPYR